MLIAAPYGGGTNINAACPQDYVQGTVFLDANENGTQDSEERHIRGAIVALQSEGTPERTATSDDTGKFTFSNVTQGVALRVRIKEFPAGLNGGVSPATTIATETKFIASAPTCTINFALTSPRDTCTHSPRIAYSQFSFERYNHPGFGNLQSVASFKESDGSNSTTSTAAYLPQAPLTYALNNQVGTIWGLAFDARRKRLYASSHIRRHADLGPTQNPTTIYRLSTQNPPLFAPTPFITLDPSRSDPHTGDSDGWLVDNGAFDKVFKEGLGDLELNDSGTKLYTIDLRERSLVEIPIESSGSAGIPQSLSILDHLPPSIIGSNQEQCARDDLRPFALGFFRGTLYIGITCSAASTVPTPAPLISSPHVPGTTSQRLGDRSKLRAFIVSWNGSVTSPLLTLKTQFPLNYKRTCHTFPNHSSCEGGATSRWAPWISSYPFLGQTTHHNFAYAQPLLSDLAFDGENIVAFLSDRGASQTGEFTPAPTGGTINNSWGAGDLVYLCNINGTLIAEQNISGDARCHNGARPFNSALPTNEYFFEDDFGACRPEVNAGGTVIYANCPASAADGGHGETALGSGVVIPGRRDIIAATYNPLRPIRGQVWQGGFNFFDREMGTWVKSVRVYTGSTWGGIFGKAAGLGDTEALCDPPSLEIGERVWLDTNRNGMQDSSEQGIAQVVLELWDTATDTRISQTTTDNSGYYLFGGPYARNLPFGVFLKENAPYEIRIQKGQLALNGLLPTTPEEGSDRLIDSNGIERFTDITTSFTTSYNGEHNHSYDFGFAAPAPPPPPTTTTTTTTTSSTSTTKTTIIVTTSTTTSSIPPKAIPPTQSPTPATTPITVPPTPTSTPPLLEPPRTPTPTPTPTPMPTPTPTQTPLPQTPQAAECLSNVECRDCAGVPYGTAAIDCCGICNGDGSTCLDKCIFYDLKKQKRAISRGLKTLRDTAVRYAAQQKRCAPALKQKNVATIDDAKAIYQRGITFITENFPDKMKYCNTPFCNSKNLSTTRSTIRTISRQLLRLSQKAQRGSIAACGSAGVQGRSSKKGSASSRAHTQAQRGAAALPSQGCLN